MPEQFDDINSDLDLDFDLEEQAEEGEDDSPVSAENIAAEHALLVKKKRKMSLFSRIPVQLTLEVASVEISLAELMSINNDSIIELDKMAGEPLDIKVNGVLFGKAEVVVINDKYGLRIIEFSQKDLSELAL